VLAGVGLWPDPSAAGLSPYSSWRSPQREF
jgi:hypothetical protein